MLPFKIISQFHIDICSKTLWVNTERGAKNPLNWPSKQLTNASRWSWTVWTLEECELIAQTWTKQQSGPLPLCLSAHNSLGEAQRVLFTLYFSRTFSSWYFLVIQCCRKSGKYTPPSQKSEKRSVLPLKTRCKPLFILFYFTYLVLFVIFLPTLSVTWSVCSSFERLKTELIDITLM